MKKLLVVLVLLFFGGAKVWGQSDIQDSTISLFLASASYGFEIPGGDMADRFGNSNGIGLSASYKMKNNYLFSLDFKFLFSRNVREDPLQSIKSDKGFLINGQGLMEPVDRLMRGYYAMAKAGKVFPWFGPNPNSGVYFQLGGGFMQHKIKYNNISSSLFQLKGDYKKGYDRLSNGFALSESIGFQYLSNNKLINFSVGFEFIQAFTKNRRDWNFDTMEKNDDLRIDLLYGIHFKWSYPIYEKAPQEHYYH